MAYGAAGALPHGNDANGGGHVGGHEHVYGEIDTADSDARDFENSSLPRFRGAVLALGVATIGAAAVVMAISAASGGAVTPTEPMGQMSFEQRAYVDYTSGDGRDPPEVVEQTAHKHTESCGKGCSETVYDDDTSVDTAGGANADGEDGGDGPTTTDGTLIPPKEVASHPVMDGQTFDGGSDTLTYGFGPGTADLSSADPLTFGMYRDGYPAFSDKALELYGKWDYVAEPHVTMVLHATNHIKGASYTWQVTNSETGETLDDLEYTQEGSKLTVEFPDANDMYTVRLSEENSKTNEVMRWTESVSVATKYVRREIRTLAKADRERYFEAMEVVFSVGTEEGQAKYGIHYLGHGHLVALHDSDGGYHYHGNLFFLTSHPAFQLKIERSLRAVKRGVDCPYWDFMADANLGDEWYNATVYREDWFGTTDNTDADDARIRGRFRDVKLVYDPNSTAYPESEHNPYGFLTDGNSMAKSEYLQRTNNVCGFGAIQGFSDCHRMADCFSNYTNLYDWDKCVEDYVHANLHQMHAGMWDCETDWKEEFSNMDDFLDRHLLSFLGYQLSAAVRSKVFDTLLSCPSSCDIKTQDFWGAQSTSDCRCKPLSSTGITTPSDIDDLADIDVYEYLASFYSGIYSSGYLSKDFMVENTNVTTDDYMEYSFKGLSHAQSSKVNKMYLKSIAFPGSFGVMGSGAATNDPLFWVMHQVFDKMVHVLRLSPEYKGYNITWNNHEGSEGSDWKGTTTPFKGEIFEPYLKNSTLITEYLDNKQLWSLLDPTGGAIPYVYDDLTEWGACAFDPMQGLGTEDLLYEITDRFGELR